MPPGQLSVVITVEHEGLGDGEEGGVPHGDQVSRQELKVGGKLVTKLVNTVQEQEEQRTHGAFGGLGVRPDRSDESVMLRELEPKVNPVS